jgi:hypothetical protein
MLLETYGISGRLYASGAAFLADLPRKTAVIGFETG